MEILFKEITCSLIGACMKVYFALGHGFLEVIYKDAITIEFDNCLIPVEREKRYNIKYAGIILPHYFIADFIVEKNIILEIKTSTLAKVL